MVKVIALGFASETQAQEGSRANAQKEIEINNIHAVGRSIWEIVDAGLWLAWQNETGEKLDIKGVEKTLSSSS